MKKKIIDYPYCFIYHAHRSGLMLQLTTEASINPQRSKNKEKAPQILRQVSLKCQVPFFRVMI